MSIWPIYVPTYGRAGTSQTLAGLLDECLRPILCVEAHEMEMYRREYPELQVIVNFCKPRSIAGARQTILQDAREQGHRWYWQIDDTVMGIAVRRYPRAIARQKSWSYALERLQLLKYQHKKIALISTDFKHIATFAEAPFRMNTRCMVVTGTRTDTKLNYDTSLAMKEDLDFCIQHLRKGWKTILSHLHVQIEVDMGKNTKGGMVELYAKNGFHLKGCFDLIRKWPQWVKMGNKRHGRPEVKIDWAKMNRRDQDEQQNCETGTNDHDHVESDQKVGSQIGQA